MNMKKKLSESNLTPELASMTDKKAKKRLLKEMAKTGRLEIARVDPCTNEITKTEVYE